MYICNYIYLDLSLDFEDRFGQHIANPYDLRWNFLRDKLISLERFIFIGSFLAFLRPSNLSWYKYTVRIEDRIPVRALIIYWQYSMGDVIDRWLFNTHEYGWNDLLLHLYVIYYIYQTIRVCLKSPR